MRLLPYSLLALLACGSAQPPPQALRPEPVNKTSSEPQPEEHAAPSASSAAASAPPVAQPPEKPEIVLSALAAEQRTARDETGRRRIGVHRDLPRLPSPEAAWTVDEQGAPVWRVTIRSAGAVALRLHFSDFHLAGGQVVAYESGEGLRAGAPRYTRDGPAGDGEFWSDLIVGDTAIVEHRPAEAAIGAGPVPFRIDKLSHLWQSPLDAF